MATVLLGVRHFPEAYTAQNISVITASLMAEWGIRDKVTCIVTDAAPNMKVYTRELNLKHAICIAHFMNLVVKRLSARPLDSQK